LKRKELHLVQTLQKSPGRRFQSGRRRRERRKRLFLLRRIRKRKERLKAVKLLGLLVSSLLLFYEMIISIKGRELFTFNVNMGGDDDEAEDIEIEKEVCFFSFKFCLVLF
jgi:hypothetical protein